MQTTSSPYFFLLESQVGANKYTVFTHVKSHHIGLLVSLFPIGPIGLVWYNNMTAIFLFWNTNMAAVTSRENALKGRLAPHPHPLPHKKMLAQPKTEKRSFELKIPLLYDHNFSNVPSQDWNLKVPVLFITSLIIITWFSDCVWMINEKLSVNLRYSSATKSCRLAFVTSSATKSCRPAFVTSSAAGQEEVCNGSWQFRARETGFLATTRVAAWHRL